MTSSIVLWSLAALLLFWSVGAYNRLMRLRAAAKSTFETLEAELSRQVELVRTQLPAADAAQPASMHDDTTFWTALHAAANQFAASLNAAKNKPLDGEGIAALSAAQDVLAMAWERAERDDAHDLAGPRLPDTVIARRALLSQQAGVAVEQFNAAVARYNTAIGQFPAMLLAWLFGFKAARGLQLRS
ncbi:LemA family protein [Caenimonas koreensis]|uniref:LemA family protein n=1 Tax=Caenimonas koreensis DSM 17982 TaxID=1121255 RepID=A0A844BD92_9BURK|nr:LemA family protein [Caenimonas koreensis]MRD49669.1 LemA family protein [Caenimonas koreensis DSM 17982]